MLGEGVAHMALVPTGVVGDRAFALLDRSDGHIASAKHPRKWGRLLQLRARYTDDPGLEPERVQLVVEFPDGTSIAGDAPRLDGELQRFTGRDVTLVAGGGGSATVEALWPDIDGLARRGLIEDLSGGRTDGGEALSAIPVGSPAGAYVDLAPVHLLTTSSLGQLIDLDPRATFDLRRYRPNIILEIPRSGFVENDWRARAVTLDRGVTLRVTIPRVRCVLTTLAHGELPADRDTLRAIARSNRLDVPEFGGSWACLGVYADVTAAGEVRVGDEVVISH